MASAPPFSQSKAFNAPLASRFTFTGWLIEPQQNPDNRYCVTFSFECDHFGPFSETVIFPDHAVAQTNIPDEDMCNLLDLLHIALGVSYYKCAAAPLIILPTSYNKPSLLEMTHALYQDGLAEFHIRAGLPFPASVTFEFTDDIKLSKKFSPPPATAKKQESSSDRTQALVAFGGGKDSHVAAHLLERGGLPSQLVSCVTSDHVAAALSASSRQPVLFIQRKLSERLSVAIENGAHNGHVPITAINALAITLLGYLCKSPYTVFANERSADEATLEVNGMSANHQFSKSSMFEKQLIAAIAEASRAAPLFFSILRPYAEIGIAKIFAQIPAAHSLFTSCNRNFKISGGAPKRWCGACAKCAFTALMLAPYLTSAQAQSIFGDNFLDKANLYPIYRDLSGLTEQKPWDCVGTIDEVCATFYQLKDNKEWHHTKTVAKILPEILDIHSPEILERHWQAGFEPTPHHNIPDKLWEAVRDL